MIITRTPLRISLAGGGSDLPAFWKDEEPGHVVSVTIDKYVYLTVNQKYDGGVRISYSKTENVGKAADVEHPLVRAALSLANIRRGIEIVSVADLPHGTGLGSSSAFTVGLLSALYAHQGEFRTTDAIANDACTVEINQCRQPIGKQDQYAAAFGGLRSYTFHPDGRVSTEAIKAEGLLGDYLILFDTGMRREASAVLSTLSLDDTRKRADIRAMANMAVSMRDALRLGRLSEVGDIMDGAWALKRNLGATTDQIDRWYTAAKQAGAIGGKVCGAGGGGFMLFVAPPDKHPAIARAIDLRPIPFHLIGHGTQIIYAV